MRARQGRGGGVAVVVAMPSLFFFWGIFHSFPSSFPSLHQENSGTLDFPSPVSLPPFTTPSVSLFSLLFSLLVYLLFYSVRSFLSLFFFLSQAGKERKKTQILNNTIFFPPFVLENYYRLFLFISNFRIPIFFLKKIRPLLVARCYPSYPLFSSLFAVRLLPQSNLFVFACVVRTAVAVAVEID